MKLRPYQEQSVRDIFKAWKKHRRVLYTLATGGGKTVIAAKVIQQLVRSGKIILILAHRRELIRQMRDKLIELEIDADDIGIIMSGFESNAFAPIQVASIDTLRNRKVPYSDVVVIDEAHRTGANTYQQILSWCQNANILGLTATPRREDGKALGDSYDVIVEGPKPSELIKQNAIVAPRIFTKIDGESVNLRGVRKVNGDYAATELSKRLNTKRQRGDVVEHVRKRAQGRATVVFACDVEHAKALVRDFKRAKVKAELLLGETDKETRDALIGPKGKLARGVVQVIVTVMVVSEGWDLPLVKCAVLARPTTSLTLFLQQAGRILRPYKGITPIILDHYGNVLQPKFGFPDEDRTWSLDAEEKNGVGAAPVKQCPEEHCGAVCPASCMQCPECGYDFEVKRRQAEKEAGELMELTRQALEARRQQEISRFFKESAKAGLRDWMNQKIEHRLSKVA